MPEISESRSTLLARFEMYRIRFQYNISKDTTRYHSKDFREKMVKTKDVRVCWFFGAAMHRNQHEALYSARNSECRALDPYLGHCLDRKDHPVN